MKKRLIAYPIAALAIAFASYLPFHEQAKELREAQQVAADLDKAWEDHWQIRREIVRSDAEWRKRMNDIRRR